MLRMIGPAIGWPNTESLAMNRTRRRDCRAANSAKMKSR